MKQLIWQVVIGAVAMIVAFALAVALGIVLAPVFKMAMEGM